MIKKYLFYIFRWQLGTPVFAIVMHWKILQELNSWWIVGIANFIGALIFFWIDRFIFTKK